MSLKLHSLKDKWPLGSNLHRILASKCLFSKTETLSLSHTFLVVFISSNCSGIIKSLHNKTDRLILIFFFSFSSYNSLKHTYSQAWISWRCFFRPFCLRQIQSCCAHCRLLFSFISHTPACEAVTTLHCSWIFQWLLKRCRARILVEVREQGVWVLFPRVLESFLSTLNQPLLWPLLCDLISFCPKGTLENNVRLLQLKERRGKESLK